jgi:hypothetical protein
MYMMASIVYLVFGLALTSMCINVVQVRIYVVISFLISILNRIKTY